MKKIITAVIFGLSLLNAQAQNEKNLVIDGNAEVRRVTGFNAIDVSGAIDLYISQGTEEAVAISANSDEIRSRIRTELKGTTLRIYLDGHGLNWRIWGNNKMKAYVTFKSLASVEASGACNVKTTGTIKQNSLKVEMSGASDFSGDVDVSQLKLDASGASNIKVSGIASSTTIDASGACSIKGYDLKTDICKIEASGASTVRITVNKELNAGASGGSTVLYRGAGLIRDINTSSGASVKHKSDD